jgi:hypothetical protein
MKYLEELKALNFPKDQFAIFGSGPLAIRGMRDNADIDIIVTDELWNELMEKYPENFANGYEIKFGNISAINDWKPWFEDNNELISGADVIDGVRFVSLENVLKWKKALNREKDQKDIKILEDYLEKFN